MNRPVGDKPSNIVPANLRAELEKADKTLQSAQTTHAANTKPLTDAHEGLLKARQQARIDPSPVESVLYQNWPALAGDLGRAWERTKKDLLGEDQVKVKDPWGHNPEALRSETRSVDGLREGITTLLADADPEALTHFGGDAAATIQALKGLQKIEQDRLGAKEYATLLPASLAKLNETVDARAHELRTSLRAVLKGEKNASEFFDSPVLAANGLIGSTIGQVLRGWAQLVEKNPGQGIIKPRKDSTVTREEIVSRLLKAAEASESSDVPAEKVTDAFLWFRLGFEGPGFDFLKAASAAHQAVGWHGVPDPDAYSEL